MNQPYFKEIRKEILAELSKAQKHIKIAVAWFTNRELFDLLCNKLRTVENIKVELIIINDFINNNPKALDWQYFINSGGELYFTSSENPMHSKYCLIDNEVLISGSYNWTYYAEDRNIENIIIFKEEPTLIEHFNTNYEQERSKLSLVKQNVRVGEESLEMSSLTVSKIAAYELKKKGESCKKGEVVEHTRIIGISPHLIKKSELVEAPAPKKVRRLKSSIGVSCHNDTNMKILHKHEQIPITRSKEFRTVVPYQTTVRSPIIRGESSDASKCSTICILTLHPVPPRHAGGARNDVTLHINDDGMLKVTKKCQITNKRVTKIKDINYLLEDVILDSVENENPL